MSGKPFAQVEKAVALAKQKSTEPTIILFEPHVTLFSENSQLKFSSDDLFCFCFRKETNAKQEKTKFQLKCNQSTSMYQINVLI